MVATGSIDPSARDDFSSTTRHRLAQRAGYMCSSPECRRLTVGPSEDRVSGLTMVGVAAHITAAAEIGPSFDPLMSSLERSSEDNGIWLCQNHAKFVDDTESTHTVNELRRWKKQHEDWVFARVNNSASLLRNGLTSIYLENLGPFRSRTGTELGRTNVIYGLNESGKTTLCEAIAALSGGANFERLQQRWLPFGIRSPSMVIEATVAVDDARTIVRLSEEQLGRPFANSERPKRLHVQVDGNVAPHWPQALFNVVILEEQSRRQSVKDPFRQALRSLASQLGMDEERIWDMLREELLCGTPLGYRVRRTGRHKAEVLVPGGAFWTEMGGVSGGQLSLAFFDIMITLLRADRRRTPWILLVDSELFLHLDANNKRRLFETLTGLEDPRLQTAFCVNHASDATTLGPLTGERWVRSGEMGELTIHTFL